MDLLNKLGSKSSVNEVNKAPTKDDIIAKSAEVTVEEPSSIDPSVIVVSEEDSLQTKVEIKNPDTWTTESALKEVKKLREENKATRLKYQEAIKLKEQEALEKIKEKEQEYQELLNKASELDRIKEAEDDRKRDLSEKLTHREQKIAELESKLNNINEDFQRKLTESQSRLEAYEAEKAAREHVFKQELEDELSKVPEKFRQQAELLIRGAGDSSQDGLLALREAKLMGMFQDKTVVVNHSVPNANNGARTTQERLQEAKRAELDKMSSSQKIKEALKGIRDGESNSAYRGR